MYIQTSEMRDNFISGLREKYARSLPTKSIKNKTDIMFAATNLYVSGTPFVSPINEATQPHYGSDEISLLSAILDPFVTMVWEYFNMVPAPATQLDFDVVHKRLCDEFLNDIADAGRYIHTYGNAQKMTNMLFKYLVCFVDASGYADWFRYCHVALDRYTYNGYRLQFYGKVVFPSINGRSAPALESWSQIATYADYKTISDDIISYIGSHSKTYNDYVDICDHFHTLPTISKLSADYVLTPFEAEFFIWTIAKACMKKTSDKKDVYSSSFVRNIRALL